MAPFRIVIALLISCVAVSALRKKMRSTRKSHGPGHWEMKEGKWKYITWSAEKVAQKVAEEAAKKRQKEDQMRLRFKGVDVDFDKVSIVLPAMPNGAMCNFNTDCGSGNCDADVCTCISHPAWPGNNTCTHDEDCTGRQWGVARYCHGNPTYIKNGGCCRSCAHGVADTVPTYIANMRFKYGDRHGGAAHMCPSQCMNAGFYNNPETNVCDECTTTSRICLEPGDYLYSCGPGHVLGAGYGPSEQTYMCLPCNEIKIESLCQSMLGCDWDTEDEDIPKTCEGSWRPNYLF